MHLLNLRLHGLLVLALLACAGCLHAPNAGTVSPVKQEEVVVKGAAVEVALQTWPHTAQVQGTLFADEVATVGTKVPGRITEVHCDLGDQVEADQVLVKIDTSEYELLAAQAESQLAQARSAVGLKPEDPVEKLNPLNAPPVREAAAVLDEAKQLVKRLQTLFEQGAVVATDLEAAQAAATVAEARYNSALNSVREKIALIGVQTALRSLAQERLQETTIIAPFKGMVQNRSVAIGSYVNVGQPILELVKTSVLRYRAAVPERLAASIRLGQRVRLKALDKEVHEVQITRISPTLDPVSRSLTFEALVPNADGRLLSGSFAQAEIVLDEQSQTLAIPSQALVRFAGVDKVWRIKEGKVSEAVIQMGREENGLVEVLSGLEAGALVLADGSSGRVGRYQDPASSADAVAAQLDAPKSQSKQPVAVNAAAAETEQSVAPEHPVAAQDSQTATSPVSVAAPPTKEAERLVDKSAGDKSADDKTAASETAGNEAAVQPGLGR